MIGSVGGVIPNQVQGGASILTQKTASTKSADDSSKLRVNEKSLEEGQKVLLSNEKQEKPGVQESQKPDTTQGIGSTIDVTA